MTWLIAVIGLMAGGVAALWQRILLVRAQADAAAKAAELGAANAKLQACDDARVKMMADWAHDVDAGKRAAERLESAIRVKDQAIAALQAVLAKVDPGALRDQVNDLLTPKGGG